MQTLLACLLCTAIVCGVVKSQAISLTPQYDDVATKLRIFTVHRPLILSCDVTPATANVQLTWTLDGTNVNEVSELQGRFEIIQAENKFVIDRTVEADNGLYACEYQDRRAIFNVVANVASRITRDTQLIEGESLWIVCRVVGTSPKVTWILPNNTTLTNSTEHIVLERENDLDNSALYIASVRMEDRGNYTCIAENAATSAPGFEPVVVVGMVRVRSKLAPLWPVCGILAQCFVLFVVLFIYEKWFHDEDDIDDDLDNGPLPSKADKYNRKDKSY